jgi:hypothetical protein
MKVKSLASMTAQTSQKRRKEAWSQKWFLWQQTYRKAWYRTRCLFPSLYKLGTVISAVGYWTECYVFQFQIVHNFYLNFIEGLLLFLAQLIPLHKRMKLLVTHCVIYKWKLLGRSTYQDNINRPQICIQHEPRFET